MTPANKWQEKDKQAVVLSGGGAFGAFEIGVLRALVQGKSPATDHQSLDAEIFCGTSVGAYNAAVLASKWDLDPKDAVEHLEDLWLSRIAGSLADNGVLRIRGNVFEALDPREVLRRRGQQFVEALSDAAYLSRDLARRLAYFFRSTESLTHRAIEMFDFSSLISTAPLKILMHETLPFEEIQKSDKVLKIAATNWMTGELRIFVHDPARKDVDWKEEEEEGLSESNWPDAVMASTAIPGTFPTVTLDGDQYVDGGVVMNTPLKPAISAGATTIHLICLNQAVNRIPVDEGPPCTLGVFERLLSLVVSSTVEDDVGTARFINKLIETGSLPKDNGKYRQITIHRYNPAIALGGLTGILDFRAESMRKRFGVGEHAAVEHDCEQEGCVIPGKPHHKSGALSRREPAVGELPMDLPGSELRSSSGEDSYLTGPGKPGAFRPSPPVPEPHE